MISWRSIVFGSTLILLPGTALADEVPSAATAAPAADGVWRISTGINYSQGDYGETQDTKVVSVPLALKYKRGRFTVRVSVPYVHIDGPGSLIDTPQGRDAGFGDSGGSSSGTSGSSSGTSGSSSGSSGSSGSGSSGSGSSGSGSGSSGSGGGSGSDDSSGGGGGTTTGGTVVGVPAAPGTRRDGIGDVAVTMGYSLPLAGTTFLDLSGRIKLPTASTLKRLGTGKVDLTLGADLVQDIGNASLYVGARHKLVGKPAGSTLRDTWGFGGGASYRLEGGTIIGADYDWQQSSTAKRGPSSEVTGWVNFGLTRKMRLQFFASTGFTQNSADLAGGLTLSFRLN